MVKNLGRVQSVQQQQQRRRQRPHCSSLWLAHISSSSPFSWRPPSSSVGSVSFMPTALESSLLVWELFCGSSKPFLVGGTLLHCCYCWSLHYLLHYEWEQWGGINRIKSWRSAFNRVKERRHKETKVSTTIPRSKGIFGLPMWFNCVQHKSSKTYTGCTL